LAGRTLAARLPALEALLAALPPDDPAVHLLAADAERAARSIPADVAAMDRLLRDTFATLLQRLDPPPAPLPRGPPPRPPHPPDSPPVASATRAPSPRTVSPNNPLPPPPSTRSTHTPAPPASPVAPPPRPPPPRLPPPKHLPAHNAGKEAQRAPSEEYHSEVR